MKLSETFGMTPRQRAQIPDSDIRAMAYGIEFYDPSDFSVYTWEQQIQVLRELRLRLKALEAQAKAARLAKAQPAKMVRCSCGHTVPASLVMSASLGSSCPDCYDRMSDE